MKLPPIFRFAVVIGLLIAGLEAPAAGRPQSPEPRLNAEIRRQVIEGLLRQLNNVYIFPDIAKKMESSVRARQARNEFDAITSGSELARVLTEDLRYVHDDNHLSVEYFSAASPYDSKKPPSEADIRLFREAGRMRNYEYSRVEILDGGVGLLQVNGFYPEEWARDTIAAAMSFLSNCDAIILDLRQNHGGAGATLLCSYFFDEAVHLCDTYNREENTTRQDWTYPIVPGKKLADKALFILTSHETISSPEELARDLQGLKRAVVVGERTHGGANPTTMFRLADHFSAAIPFARTLHPWATQEATDSAVKPDVDVPAGEALLAAHVLALRKVMSRHSDSADAVASLQRILIAKNKALETLRKEKLPNRR